MVTNKPFEILLMNTSAVEKKLRRGLDIIYAMKRPINDLVTTGISAVRIIEFQNFIVNNAPTKTMRQTQRYLLPKACSSRCEKLTFYVHSSGVASIAA